MFLMTGCAYCNPAVGCTTTCACGLLAPLAIWHTRTGKLLRVGCTTGNQHGTFLDIDYESLANIETPPALYDRCQDLSLPQSIPGKPVPAEAPKLVALRSLWNLNHEWQQQNSLAEHVLFIEIEQIKAWPMAPHRWEFIQHWVKQLGIEIWHGSVNDLLALQQTGTQFIREEYPACDHWPGDVVERPFYFGIPEHEYRSFSQFWKQVR